MSSLISGLSLVPFGLGNHEFAINVPGSPDADARITLDQIKTFAADQVPKAAPTVAESGTSRTLDINDAGKYIRLTSGSPCTLTIPDQATVTWLSDTEIAIRVAAAGIPVLDNPGVTVNDPKGVIAALVQGDTFMLKRVA